MKRNETALLAFICFLCKKCDILIYVNLSNLNNEDISITGTARFC